MINLYEDGDLKIIVPETFEENCDCQVNHKWCTSTPPGFDMHVNKLKQTLIRFIYNDGYALSLGINKDNFSNGQWIDNVKEKHYTIIYLISLNKDPFNHERIREISINKNNINLENLSNKIMDLKNKGIDKIIIDFLKS